MGGMGSIAGISQEYRNEEGGKPSEGHITRQRDGLRDDTSVTHSMHSFVDQNWYHVLDEDSMGGAL